MVQISCSPSGAVVSSKDDDLSVLPQAEHVFRGCQILCPNLIGKVQEF